MENISNENAFETIARLEDELKQVKIERDNARSALIKVEAECKRLIKFLGDIKQYLIEV